MTSRISEPKVVPIPYPPREQVRSKVVNPDMPLYVMIPRVARVLNVSDKTIRQWMRDGMPVTRLGDGTIGDASVLELDEAVRWYLTQGGLDAAKTRLAMAQAEKHEMENEVRKGELVEVRQVKDAWIDRVLACRAKLLTLPSKLGPQLTNVADPNIAATRIRDEINAALTELADEAVDRSQRRLARSNGGGGAEVSPAATADRKPVGRRKQKAQ